MKTIRIVLLIGVLLFTLSAITAADQLSVPLDHRAYQVLENAQIRGLIDKQIAVKPYSANKVLSLLTEIAEEQEQLSKLEREELGQLLEQLTRTYGTDPSPLDAVFSTGYFRTYDEETKLGASLGVTLQT
ncbi:hypothetical protein JF818_03970, partial [Sphaerochaeta sp. S2]|nr:hypothetical protein [Sphaerochaeta sp. S2]